MRKAGIAAVFSGRRSLGLWALLAAALFFWAAAAYGQDGPAEMAPPADASAAQDSGASKGGKSEAESSQSLGPDTAAGSQGPDDFAAAEGSEGANGSQGPDDSLAAEGSEGSQGSEGADEGSLEIEGVVAYEIEPVLPPPPPAAPIPKASPPAVYLVAPATGPFSPLGGDVELGVKLGLKSVGDSLALRVLDEDSPGFLRELFASPAPVVAIGHLYEASLAGAWPWYQAAGVPVVSPFLDGLAISELGESFIGLMPSPAAQGLRLAREVPKTGSRRPNQVIILQGPEPADEALAEAFREGLINPPAPEPTRRNPKPAKPRGMNAKLVLTIPVSSAGDLRVLSELKTSSRDVVLLALPSRLVLRCAPALAESDLRRATYLAPIWLATREMGALFIGASMPDFQALVPLGMGTASKPNKSLDELIIRYARAYRREPTWPALVAYEVARLAALAAADEAGAGASLADKELERSGTAGAFTLSPGGWPSTLVKIDESRLSLLP